MDTFRFSVDCETCRGCSLAIRVVPHIDFAGYPANDFAGYLAE